jgi:hypothetical protein
VAAGDGVRHPKRALGAIEDEGRSQCMGTYRALLDAKRRAATDGPDGDIASGRAEENESHDPEAPHDK